jgi:hypothetical protein
VAPITFFTSSRNICQFLTCGNRFQQYLSAVNERDGVRYWSVPLGPPQPIPIHYTL